MLVNFSNKLVFDGKVNSGQIWDKIMQPFLMIWSMGIFLKCCSKIEHSRYTTVTVNFPRKYLMSKIGYLEPIWPKLCNLISNDQL